MADKATKGAPRARREGHEKDSTTNTILTTDTKRIHRPRVRPFTLSTEHATNRSASRVRHKPTTRVRHASGRLASLACAVHVWPAQQAVRRTRSFISGGAAILMNESSS